MADPNAIKTALRRQAEAKATEAASRERSKAELRKPSKEWEPSDTTTDELMDGFILRAQLEGFMLGWLVASGKFDDHRELAEIWLDTPKELQAAVSDCSEIADPLERFNARLNLPSPRGKRSRS